MLTAYDLADWLPYLTHGEIGALHQLAQSLPDDPVIVNIGAGNGTSGLAFMESRPDVHLFTIDIQRESHPLGCLVAEQDALERAGLWNDRVQHIHDTSAAVAASWRGKVDLVFVDGNPSYEDRTQDIAGWLPHLRDNGIIAVHDYDKDTWYATGEAQATEKKPHPEHHPGCDRAVRELLLGKYEQVAHVHTLIAFRNKLIPQPVAPPVQPVGGPVRTTKGKRK